MGETSEQLRDSRDTLRIPQETMDIIVVGEKGIVLGNHIDVALQRTLVHGHPDPATTLGTIRLGMLEAIKTAKATANETQMLSPEPTLNLDQNPTMYS